MTSVPASQRGIGFVLEHGGGGEQIGFVVQVAELERGEEDRVLIIHPHHDDLPGHARPVNLLPLDPAIPRPNPL